MVINLIEQTQSTDLSSVSHTTKFTLTQPFRAANNTIQQTQMRLRQRYPHGGTMLEAKQIICIETPLEYTWTTFLLHARPTDSWLPLTQLARKWVSNVNLEPNVNQEYAYSLAPQAQQHQNWDRRNRKKWSETCWPPWISSS